MFLTHTSMSHDKRKGTLTWCYRRGIRCTKCFEKNEKGRINLAESHLGRFWVPFPGWPGKKWMKIRSVKSWFTQAASRWHPPFSTGGRCSLASSSQKYPAQEGANAKDAFLDQTHPHYHLTQTHTDTQTHTHTHTHTHCIPWASLYPLPRERRRNRKQPWWLKHHNCFCFAKECNFCAFSFRKYHINCLLNATKRENWE